MPDRILNDQGGVHVTDKKNNFKRIAENRTNKIIDMLELLGNLSNTSFYEYTDADIEKIFAAIEEQVEKTKNKFSKKKKPSRKRFEL